MHHPNRNSNHGERANAIMMNLKWHFLNIFNIYEPTLWTSKKEKKIILHHKTWNYKVSVFSNAVMLVAVEINQKNTVLSWKKLEEAITTWQDIRSQPQQMFKSKSTLFCLILTLFMSVTEECFFAVY